MARPAPPLHSHLSAMQAQHKRESAQLEAQHKQRRAEFEAKQRADATADQAKHLSAEQQEENKTKREQGKAAFEQRLKQESDKLRQKQAENLVKSKEPGKTNPLQQSKPDYNPLPGDNRDRDDMVGTGFIPLWRPWKHFNSWPGMTLLSSAAVYSVVYNGFLMGSGAAATVPGLLSLTLCLGIAAYHLHQASKNSRYGEHLRPLCKYLGYLFRALTVVSVAATAAIVALAFGMNPIGAAALGGGILMLAVAAFTYWWLKKSTAEVSLELPPGLEDVPLEVLQEMTEVSVDAGKLMGLEPTETDATLSSDSKKKAADGSVSEKENDSDSKPEKNTDPEKPKESSRPRSRSLPNMKEALRGGASSSSPSLASSGAGMGVRG